MLLSQGGGDPSSPASQQGWTAERLSQASYKDLGSPESVEERFYRHLVTSQHCKEALRRLLEESSATTRDYSITVDAFDLLHSDPVLGHLLLQYPATLLPLLESAAVRAQEDLLKQFRRDGEASAATAAADPNAQSAPNMMVKGGNMTRVHARLVHLPPMCFKPSLGGMEARDVGKIVQVTGTLVRASAVQMYESARTYRCSGSKGCGRTFCVHADMEARNNALLVPSRCPLPAAGAPGGGGSARSATAPAPAAAKRCPGTNLQPVENGSVHTDYQEIKIQETASRLGVGHIPRSLLIKLQHDLVDTAAPGDEVVVVGSLLAQWDQGHNQAALQNEVECRVGMAMSAHSIRVVAENGGSAWKSSGQNSVGESDKFRKEFEAYWACESNRGHPVAARDFICRAVCPKLFGLQIIKLALLITLIGGVSSDAYERPYDDESPGEDGAAPSQNSGEGDGAGADDDQPEAFCVRLPHGGRDANVVAGADYYGDSIPNHRRRRPKRRDDQVKTRRRDQSHLLLVGDPGTGKSQILRFAAALCPRSVLTTGVGTTSAGLTCAAVREGSGKEFALEAGALVLADKGVCCIDEFGCIQDQDRTTIHEAMEQQTLSVAKAGIVCKLNCRATIIAVMNPKDCLYDNQVSLSVNTGLGTPLLSRFDLIFKLVDASDVERDSNVTTYLLNRAIQGTGFDVELPRESPDQHPSEEPWTMEKLRAYISIVKERFQPAMSDAAALLLERHYERCRAARGNTIPVTVRFLESLIRLSQSHARLMWRNTVELEDAVAVIRVMECSAFAYGGFDGGVSDDASGVMYEDPMSIDFSNEADLDFLCFEYRVLKLYGLLDYLDEQRRCKAELELSHIAVGMNGGPDYSSWGDVESWGPAIVPAEGNVHWPPDAATAGMYSYQPPVAASGHAFAASQTALPDSDAGAQGVSYDHYGRVQLTQNQAKRRRGS